ncbi:hypothetical protein C5167_004504 [Papaver somniferum]|uniref:Uncharacterized protein n=1 Tax=Papaver somniferum TaxID=3469 RepID=A0A4Y7J8R4_PAPSO|nr:hypothetical protein C5167_004504 [Papaver somniferum]
MEILKETVKSADSPLEIWRSKLRKQRQNGAVGIHEGTEKLVTLLELDVAQGMRNHFRCQIAIAYALKKIGMLLRYLDGILKGQGTISPDADFRAWIMEKLNIEDWEDYLHFANAREGDVLFTAAAKGVELEKQIITPETIRVQDEDGFKSRLEVYHKVLKAAHNMPLKNIDCIGGGQTACSLIKGITPKLRYRHLVNPNGNIKVRGKRDGDHQTMTREVSSAKRARGTSDLDMTTMKKKKGGAVASDG